MQEVKKKKKRGVGERYIDREDRKKTSFANDMTVSRENSK